MAKKGSHSIFTEAKRLRKKYPNRFDTWQEYVSQASAIYSGKHHGRSPVGHKRKKRKPAKRSVRGLQTKSRTHTDKNRFRNVEIQIGAAVRSIPRIRSHIKDAKEIMKDSIDSLVLKKYHAKKKVQKRKLQRQITQRKSVLNNLDRISSLKFRK